MRNPQVPVTVIGAGGHAKVVLSALAAAGVPVAALADDDAATWSREIGGHAVVSPERAGLRPGSRAVLAVGDNRARRALAERFPGLDWVAVVHPSAVVDPAARVEPGAMVMAGAILQPDARVGRHAIVNTGASVDHDADVGDFAHVAPGARLAGGVRVGEGALVGIGAVAVPGATIGRWATVGAGSTVLGAVPDGAVVVGSPARPAGKEVLP